MSELYKGVEVSLGDVSPGMLIKATSSNDIQVVVAKTEERIFVQIGGPTTYKDVKRGVGANRHLVKEVDGETSGQLREYSFGTFKRKGFTYEGFCEQEELKGYILGYLKETCQVSEADIVEASQVQAEPEAPVLAAVQPEPDPEPPAEPTADETGAVETVDTPEEETTEETPVEAPQE